MLQRVLIHLSLILLFALTQIGATTHAISHLTDTQNQQQQDQDHHQNQCAQCLSYSHASGAPLAYNFVFATAPVTQCFFADEVVCSTPSLTVSYSARAPPIHT